MEHSEVREIILYEHDADEQRERLIRHRLDTFNRPFRSELYAKMGKNWPGAQPLQVYAIDSAGELIGGIIGETHGVPMWAEINILWVDDAYRGHGIGQRLVREAEIRSAAAGCESIRLSTADFQASRFYQHLGYKRYGQLENCPPGENLLLYFKRLESPQ